MLHLPVSMLLTAKAKGIEMVYGDVRLGESSLFKSRYDWRLLFNNTLHHQGLFLKRTVGGETPFDERYKVFADFDLNQRLYRKGIVAVATTEQPIARFNGHGASSHRSPSREFFQVIRSNYGPLAVAIAYFFARFRGVAFRLRRKSVLS